MHANQMSIEEFRALPYRGEDTLDPQDVATIVIVPGPADELHDSGYRAMDFVACNPKGEAICRLSGCSDVLHIDGIGGFGKDWLKRYNGVPRLVPPVGWSVDCLAVSGLLRLFPSRDVCEGIEVDDMAFSSFEIFALPKSPKQIVSPDSSG
jgi:hypothetical protein